MPRGIGRGAGQPWSERSTKPQRSIREGSPIAGLWIAERDRQGIKKINHSMGGSPAVVPDPFLVSA